MIELDYPNLQAIGFNPSLAALSAAQLAAAPPDRRLARVTAVQRDCATLDLGLQAVRVRVDPWSINPVVGDWVLAWSDRGTWRVDRILEPFTRLARRTPSGRQPLVNNVDTALLLMGLTRTSIRAGWSATSPSCAPAGWRPGWRAARRWSCWDRRAWASRR